MGIRYYAYAFDPDMYEQARAHPESVLGSDPLADAWGFEPGATGIIHASLKQSLPKNDFLYLDKAWRGLQDVTRSGGRTRPAYRMFEGDVTWPGICYESWIRTISPSEVPAIAEDLHEINNEHISDLIEIPSGCDESHRSYVEYLRNHLRKAERFVNDLSDQGRGFVYTIR